MGQLIDSVFPMLLKARQMESSGGAEDQTGGMPTPLAVRTTQVNSRSSMSSCIEDMRLQQASTKVELYGLLKKRS